MILPRLIAIAQRIAAWFTLARMRDAAFSLMFAMLLVAIQWRSGAFTADLASYGDEPAHAVSSLLVRDYLVQGLGQNPLHFAQNLYAHYSKVAIGHFPPLFYLGEGLWMLLAGRSRAALLLFVALCGVALVSSVYFEVRRRSSTVAALVSVAVLTSSTVFHEVLCAVEPDTLLALMVFWAAVHCGEFMHVGLRRNRNYFLIFTAAAMLVHGRAAVLILLPFALLPLRSKIVKWKWLMAGGVVLFLMLLPPYLHQSAHLTWFMLLPQAGDYMMGAVNLIGWPVMVLALPAMLLILRRDGQRQFWAAMGALPICGLIFYLMIPVPRENRYYTISLVAFAVLAGGGIHVLLERISLYRRTLRLAIGAAAIGWMAWAAAHVEPKPSLGYRRMVENGLLCGHEVALIAADATSEGALIVEASLSDPNRLHTVLRSSKLLAKSHWMGSDRRLLFSTSSEVLQAIDQARVSVIVLKKASRLPQVVQLRTALAEEGATEWVIVPGEPEVKGIEVYTKADLQVAPLK